MSFIKAQSKKSNSGTALPAGFDCMNDWMKKAERFAMCFDRMMGALEKYINFEFVTGYWQEIFGPADIWARWWFHVPCALFLRGLDFFKGRNPFYCAFMAVAANVPDWNVASLKCHNHLKCHINRSKTSSSSALEHENRNDHIILSQLQNCANDGCSFLRDCP